jgi:outer membrane murein-binding lipoprotein Lpp
MAGRLKMLSLIALVLGAFALGACGGTDDREATNAYVRQLNAAQDMFATDATTVAQQKASARAGQVRILRRFEATIASFTAKLRKIEVPSVVRDEHEQLIEAMAGFGADVRKAAQTLRTDDARKRDQARGAIRTAQQTANVRIDAALAAIRSKLAET